MRFGVTTRADMPYKDIVALWQEIDALGFDTAFVNDHFMAAVPGPPASERCFESWTLITALATKTERVRLGVLVSGNTYREPTVLAKMAMTVDHVSGGRLILGMGAAWLEREHIAYGLPFYTPGIRAKRLAESVEVVTRLFTQEKSTFDGTFYQLKDAPFEPKGLQQPHPPILIGGMGAKVVQPLAARHAQIWHFVLSNNDPAEAKRVCDEFDRLCTSVGRDPKEVEKATMLDPRLVDAATPDLRSHLQTLAAAGVGQVILFPQGLQDRERLQRFAHEIIPEFR
jgi:F420-dependent oxidoreductase-like protein